MNPFLRNQGLQNTDGDWRDVLLGSGLVDYLLQVNFMFTLHFNCKL